MTDPKPMLVYPVKITVKAKIEIDLMSAHRSTIDGTAERLIESVGQFIAGTKFEHLSGAGIVGFSAVDVISKVGKPRPSTAGDIEEAEKSKALLEVSHGVTKN